MGKILDRERPQILGHDKNTSIDGEKLPLNLQKFTEETASKIITIDKLPFCYMVLSIK